MIITLNGHNYLINTPGEVNKITVELSNDSNTKTINAVRPVSPIADQQPDYVNTVTYWTNTKIEVDFDLDQIFGDEDYYFWKVTEARILVTDNGVSVDYQDIIELDYDDEDNPVVWDGGEPAPPIEPSEAYFVGVYAGGDYSSLFSFNIDFVASDPVISEYVGSVWVDAILSDSSVISSASGWSIEAGASGQIVAVDDSAPFYSDEDLFHCYCIPASISSSYIGKTIRYAYVYGDEARTNLIAILDIPLDARIPITRQMVSDEWASEIEFKFNPTTGVFDISGGIDAGAAGLYLEDPVALVSAIVNDDSAGVLDWSNNHISFQLDDFIGSNPSDIQVLILNYYVGIDVDHLGSIAAYDDGYGFTTDALNMAPDLDIPTGEIIGMNVSHARANTGLPYEYDLRGIALLDADIEGTLDIVGRFKIINTNGTLNATLNPSGATTKNDALQGSIGQGLGFGISDLYTDYPSFYDDLPEGINAVPFRFTSYVEGSSSNPTPTSSLIYELRIYDKASAPSNISDSTPYLTRYISDNTSNMFLFSGVTGTQDDFNSGTDTLSRNNGTPYTDEDYRHGPPEHVIVHNGFNNANPPTWMKVYTSSSPEVTSWFTGANRTLTIVDSDLDGHTNLRVIHGWSTGHPAPYEVSRLPVSWDNRFTLTQAQNIATNTMGLIDIFEE